MPKTIIQVKTYMCPDGIGKVHPETGIPRGTCRFHRAWDNLTEDKKCPTCHLTLQKSTVDHDRMSLIVMGEEQIEVEIDDRDEAKHRVLMLSNIDRQVEMMDEQGEYATDRKKELQRTMMKETAEKKIEEKKNEGYFLIGKEQIDAYRAERVQYIKDELVKARKHEDI